MVPWRSGYRGGLLSRFPLGAQVRILPASNFFNVAETIHYVRLRCLQTRDLLLVLAIFPWSQG